MKICNMHCPIMFVTVVFIMFLLYWIIFHCVTLDYTSVMYYSEMSQLPTWSAAWSTTRNCNVPSGPTSLSFQLAFVVISSIVRATHLVPSERTILSTFAKGSAINHDTRGIRSPSTGIAGTRI